MLLTFDLQCATFRHGIILRLLGNKMSREVSKAKQLEKLFGGKWLYDNFTRWNCDDGKRYVARVSDGTDECGDSTGTAYTLYDENGVGKRIVFGKYRVRSQHPPYTT